MPTPKDRIRYLNSHKIRENGDYVLYWMQAYRRFASNHSLDHAVELAKKLKKELIVYEGLRIDYPWNSERIHKFILEGMIENKEEAEKLGVNYWCYVEHASNPAKGLLKKIAEKACIIITDDFPCFIIPEQTKKLADKVTCPVIAVDGNSVIPFSQFEKAASAARILRIWIHKRFADSFFNFAKPKYSKKDFAGLNSGTPPPFSNFELKESGLPEFLQSIAFENKVAPDSKTFGGRSKALGLLNDFLKKKIHLYDTERSSPRSFAETPVSGLSAYLHFGHISAEEIVLAVLENATEDWTPEELILKKPGDRENFYSKSVSANHYLDELITWRDIGYLFFWQKPSFRIDLNSLPEWVQKNISYHKKDVRDYQYSLEDWEASRTHDELWNAAQTELKHTGRMHNYMRMLWGKKVIEWSKTYEEAFHILEHLNNKYAYDGRNPNSYTGILWCFGLFDRPWFPERNVFGNIRYMSSDSTRKKFKMKPYLDYVNSLNNSEDLLFP
ncbi:deoxyribodipyrimidine photolyase [Leptospira sp. 'Mane']|uniref:deoxyribodipyrimidine photolyase n=1 Tax=Leptospira sp. 'Mane' TaxID=3387407 RepID=UPI00398ABB5E